MGGLRKRGTWGFRKVDGDDDNKEQQNGRLGLLTAEDFRIIENLDLEGRYKQFRLSFMSGAGVGGTLN